MNLATRIYAIERATTSTINSAKAVAVMRQAGVKFSSLPSEDLATMKKISSEALDRMAGKDEDTQRVLKIIFDTRDTLGLRPAEN